MSRMPGNIFKDPRGEPVSEAAYNCCQDCKGFGCCDYDPKECDHLAAELAKPKDKDE